jgi:hypothetical protein
LRQPPCNLCLARVEALAFQSWCVEVALSHCLASCSVLGEPQSRHLESPLRSRRGRAGTSSSAPIFCCRSQIVEPEYCGQATLSFSSGGHFVALLPGRSGRIGQVPPFRPHARAWR